MIQFYMMLNTLATLPKSSLAFAKSIGMATSALKSAPDSLQFDNVGRNREGIKLSGDNKKLLAPNGKPSNLNAMQHAQVRTEAFKKWFGDWETAQIIHELKNGKPFIVIGNEFADFSEPLNMKKLRSEAITYGESNIVGKYENKYSGIKLEVRRGGIDESIQHGSGPEKLKALASIKDILVNGYVVYDGINPKNKKGRLVAISKRVDISGKSFVVTVGLREDANGRLFYDHELLDTRRAEGLSSQSSEGLSPQHPAPTSTRLNDYYIRFIEKDTNSSKVVDENGEPLVVYHGTDNIRDVFKKGESGALGPGIYTTQRKDHAKTYGDYVQSLYVNSKNPLIISDTGRLDITEAIARDKKFEEENFHSRGTASKSAKDQFEEHAGIGDPEFNTMLRDAGYDSIIYKKGNVFTELSVH